MIPKIQPRGASFKGLAAYLTHDPKEKSSDRVAWTHTHNLAHDHILSAVDEMYWTAENAELLKQEAGVRGGGRATESTVKHFSLNWAIEDNPTREHMIETAKDFLRHMKWHEHQAIFIAHNDKDYAHVHVMLNAIHPETGLRLEESFEHRRAQAWALDYERAQGQIHCPERLKDVEDREQSMPRPAWIAFKENEKEFERDEKSRQENIAGDEYSEINPKIVNFAEWKKLKEIQKQEREAFFTEGKIAFTEIRREIYKEIRGEFRERWAEYYNLQKSGGDANELALLKSCILAEQKELLDERRKTACDELRQERDLQYRELLDDQRDTRQSLRSRQELGFDNTLFLEALPGREPPKKTQELFEENARAVTERQEDIFGETFLPFNPTAREDNGRVKSPTDVSANIATGLGFGFLDLVGGLADSITGSTPPPKPKPRPIAKEGPSLFDIVAEDASKQRVQRERDEADEDWRKRQERSRGE